MIGVMNKISISLTIGAVCGIRCVWPPVLQMVLVWSLCGPPPPIGTLWPCIWLQRRLWRIGNGVETCLEEVRKALEMLELNVPTAHQGRVAWMFLVASLEVQNQA